jgi:hypothetical protein
MKKSIFLVILGVLIGLCTVPSLDADSDGNTYKSLLHRVIDIVAQIQISSQQTADNTKAIKEHFGIK